MAKKQKHTEQFQNFNIVVFGGTGDLALRKIYPALYHRYIDGQLNCKYNIIAITRKTDQEQTFISQVRLFVEKNLESSKTNKSEIEAFMTNIHLTVAKEPSVEGYKSLKTFLNKHKDFQNIYYFSTPSSAFGPISKALKASDLAGKNSKVVLEKPLGHSLESSISINDEITQAFEESQIYRIDHYLGKETVQNLMVLRFANNLFERAWDAEHIDSIQITVAESLGVEKRAGYYDQSGALLDMVQNHLLQLVCLVAMEPPFALNANEVRNEKLKILRSLRPFTKDSIRTESIKGQYTRGNIEGSKVSSYLEDIEKYESKTETFVALK
ncbi:glucose-6-phosphate dehydrogenase (NADP(+)), partial [Crocinitomicaceae bacterium]|nr:glucose-6-phosphate dehydrogenase (NADP(+)) [Crocinitomicaceae bacterium]